MKLTQEYTTDIEHRFKYAMIAVAVLLLIITIRLYYLQIVRGNFYRVFSIENSIKEIKIPAPRGMLFDRRGRALIENRPSFNITITPQYVVNPERTLDSLSTILKMTRPEIDVVWDKRRGQASFRPILVREDASMDEVAVVRAEKNPWDSDSSKFDLRGVDVEVTFKRFYPEPVAVSHLMGYVREIGPERLKALEEKYPGRYRPGDMIGVGGVEEEWDLWLKGRDGYQEKIVDAIGREVDLGPVAADMAQEPAFSGSNIYLTVDIDLQKLAMQLFEGKRGAAVVVDTGDGAVRALYSAPSYDLAKLAGINGGSYWNQIANSPDHPVLNRAIQGGYPPGSTFKIVTAIAALSEKIIGEGDTLGCFGAYVYGGRPYHCWRRGGHGATALNRAIASSCDVYFYLTGLKLGVDRIADYAKMFGFGRETGINLPGEKSGLIPTSEWKLKRFGAPWQEGETLSISVGQGYDNVTPLQNAMFVAQVAGEKKLVPHLVENARDIYGNVLYEWKAPAGAGDEFEDKDEIETVRKAMVGTVRDPEGTAHALSVKKVTMGGKTGTAQVVALDGPNACKGEKCKDHAWFIGFAPADEPKVAAAVVVEHGGFGASAAAPIVGALLEKYCETSEQCTANIAQ